MSARLASTFIHLAFTAHAGIARGTGARETGNAVHTAPVVARVWRAVIHVALTHRALKALRAAALVAIWLVHTLGTVPAGCAGALIHVQLTHGPAEARGARAAEAIDSVLADPTVNTRAALTLIHVHLTIGACETCHADAGKLAYAVQTRGLVAAGTGEAFIDIGLTARTGVATAALAQE